MKTLNSILTQLKTDIAADLPALLGIAGVSDFARYEVGNSKDPQEIGFFIYQNITNLMLDQNAVSIIFQMQLYQVEYLEAAIYQDVLTTYLKAYSPANIGCDLLRKMEADIWPIEHVAGSYCFVVANWTDELDDCSD